MKKTPLYRKRFPAIKGASLLSRKILTDSCQNAKASGQNGKNP
jgi:hypothetical protein